MKINAAQNLCGGRKGFTLAEMMFSLVIFSMMLSLVVYDLIAISKFQQAIRNKVAATAAARLVMDHVKRTFRFYEPGTFAHIDTGTSETWAFYMAEGNLIFAPGSGTTRICYLRYHDMPAVVDYLNNQIVFYPDHGTSPAYKIGEGITEMSMVVDEEEKTAQVALTATKGNISTSLATTIKSVQE